MVGNLKADRKRVKALSVITVGRLCPEDVRVNKGGEERWIKGTVHLYGTCRSLLSEIRQRKLPFTITTGKIIPNEPVILLGEITTYPIPNTDILWKTLNIQKFITKDSPLLEELGVDFTKAYILISRKDKEFLDKLGQAEMRTREKLKSLLGDKNKFVDHLIELFEDNAYDELVKNPWRMINIIPYFTIKQADKVAETLGIPLNDERRFREYFRYLLDQSFESHRNTYILENEFIAFYWMNFSDDMSLEEYRHLTLGENAPIIRTNIGYHPAHFYFAEKASYNVIMKSLQINVPTTAMEETVTEQVLKESLIPLTEEQTHAVKSAFHTPLHIITGGPGTGKTTVLNAVLSKLLLLTGIDPNSEYAPFLLAAPTGKAAYRMWEQTGVIAHTIHSAFGIIPEYGCLNVKETAKRLSHIRYLIIDESSMLDTRLFGDMCRVLLAMNHLPFILLVGDADQLQPVQHGQVFRDLLDFLMEFAPEHVTQLTVLKRQENGSHIPELASFIKDGEFPEEEWFKDKDDIFFAPVTMDAFKNTLINGVLLPKAEELETVQILTPYRNGETPDTIHAINTFAGPLFNPPAEGEEPSVTCGKPPRTLRIGDKVINRANRSKTIINGSIGHITAINDRPRDLFAWTLDVEFENGETDTYIYEEFKQLEPAYAITIHASQGSEYENVVVCMLRGAGNSDFLNRNLLYVAATRASKRLILLGQVDAFRQIASKAQRPRKTALGHWLKHWNERR